MTETETKPPTDAPMEMDIVRADEVRRVLEPFREDELWSAAKLEAAAQIIRAARTQVREFDALIGELLLRAKANVRHGEFEPWFERLGISKASAHRRMRLASLLRRAPALVRANASHADILHGCTDEDLARLMADNTLAGLMPGDGKTLTAAELREIVEDREETISKLQADGEKARDRIRELKIAAEEGAEKVLKLKQDLAVARLDYEAMAERAAKLEEANSVYALVQRSLTEWKKRIERLDPSEIDADASLGPCLANIYTTINDIVQVRPELFRIHGEQPGAVADKDDAASDEEVV